MSIKLIFLTSILFILLALPSLSFARITPADIANERRAEYEAGLKNYSPAGKAKVELFDKKIAQLNQTITDDMELNLMRQGQILEEYTRRKNTQLTMGSKDGINRNLQDPIENAQYWLNYAHEAVAYQAARNYFINLNGEANMNRDITSQINSLESDLNVLKGRVLKSQQIISNLVSE